MQGEKVMSNFHFNGWEIKRLLITAAAFYLTACGAVENFVKLPEANANNPITH